MLSLRLIGARGTFSSQAAKLLGGYRAKRRSA